MDSQHATTLEDRRTRMAQRIRSIRDIPTLPQVVLKLNQMLRSPHSSTQEVAELLNADQALALKVLKLVNSPYYGFEGRVQNINRAIVILGFNKVRNLALSVSAPAMYRKVSSEVFDFSGFWHHSVAVAVMCETIADYTRSGEREDALIAGLLHDLGKFVLAVYFPDEFGEITRAMRAQNMASYEAEREVIGMDHGEIGGILSRQWNLPEKLSASIAWHNDPAQSGQHIELTALVHVSQFLTQALLVGNPGEVSLPPVSDVAWMHFRFDEHDVEQIYARFAERLGKASEFFAQ